jgi:hypothetical protein
LIVSASPTCARKTSSACSTVLTTRTLRPTPENVPRRNGTRPSRAGRPCAE